MTDDWDFYFCRVDNRPASIFVDLGVAKDPPLAVYPVMSYVRVAMRNPRHDGLSSSEEFDALKSMEDQLGDRLTSGGSAVYVGRNTSNGCRDFYFYCAQDLDWGARVAESMGLFSGYTYESGSRPDPDWHTYFDFLFPGDREMQSIWNRRVCNSMQRHGDELTQAREIDHWAYFPNQDSRARFLQATVALGYMLREVQDPQDGGGQFGAQVYRTDVPCLDTIDEVTWPLFDAAKEAGGKYDGWETVVIKQASPPQ